MNAYKTADELEEFGERGGDVFFGHCADLLRKLANEHKQMREFCREILVHPGDDAVGDWDGFDLQDLAEKTELLYKVHMTKPCNEGQEEVKNCICLEYCYGDESWDCFHVAKFLLNGDEL